MKVRNKGGLVYLVASVGGSSQGGGKLRLCTEGGKQHELEIRNARAGEGRGDVNG